MIQAFLSAIPPPTILTQTVNEIIGRQLAFVEMPLAFVVCFFFHISPGPDHGLGVGTCYGVDEVGGVVDRLVTTLTCG